MIYNDSSAAFKIELVFDEWKWRMHREVALSSNLNDLLIENENTRSNQIVAYHLDGNMHQAKLEQATCAFI